MKSRLLPYTFLFLSFYINLPQTVSAQTTTGFLQAKFNFTDESLEDESPNGIDGIGVDLSPVTGIEDQPNSAFEFNGTSSYSPSSFRLLCLFVLPTKIYPKTPSSFPKHPQHTD